MGTEYADPVRKYFNDLWEEEKKEESRLELLKKKLFKQLKKKFITSGK